LNVNNDDTNTYSLPRKRRKYTRMKLKKIEPSETMNTLKIEENKKYIKPNIMLYYYIQKINMKNAEHIICKAKGEFEKFFESIKICGNLDDVLLKIKKYFEDCMNKKSSYFGIIGRERDKQYVLYSNRESAAHKLYMDNITEMKKYYPYISW